MRCCTAGLLLLLLASAPGAAADDAPSFSPADLEFFEKQVRPLLIERCHKCHGAEQQKGNLRLDSRAAILKGGETGPAIVPRQPAESELIQAIRYDPSGYQMPPDGKLPEAEIAILTRWVELGAPWPEEAAATASNAASWEEEFERRMQHWSFQPLVRPAVPTVAEAPWCRTPIDRFLLAKLEAAGLPHANEADRRTWLRRVSFDVTGLAPTPAEIEAFLSDAQPGAHERVIDRLLASPHFGERWGRHWLDLVRYAESRGHEFDYDVPNPWHYRDYVIRAMNADLPYDRFVMEHVAGDLLEESSVQSPVSRAGGARPGTIQKAPPSSALDSRLSSLDSPPIVATGFWFLGEWVHSPVDIRQEEADRFESMLDVYSKTFLGLTVACARCHDHKFDPIPQTDFYALQGYLQSSVYAQVPFETREHNRRIAGEVASIDRQAAGQVLLVQAEVVAPVVDRLDEYLLGAYELVQPLENGPARKEEGDDAGPAGDRLAAVAQERRLEPRVLRAWVEHLREAQDDAGDPFHHWALLACGRTADVAAAVERLEAAIPREKDALRREEWIERAIDEGRVLDFEAFESDGWGYVRSRFLDPVVRLTSDAEQPVGLVDSGGFIEYLPELGELPNDPQAAQDPGRLSELRRAGRALRTPTFEIAHNRVCCLVRGPCETYVCVDSHVLINGPLHGSLLKKHPSRAEAPDEWRWIEHDVSRYRGHRAHLELVPHDGAGFAVMQVILADEAPPPAVSGAGLLPNSGGETSASLARFAAGYRDHWRLIPHCISWHLAEARSGWCELETTRWACRHPQLFGLDTPEARQRFAAVAAPLLEKRVALLKQLKSGSALAPVMLDGSGEDEYLFIRGNWKKRGEVVPRRFLAAFSRQHAAVSELKSGEGVRAGDSDSPRSTLNSQLSTPPAGSGRLELALQMVDPRQMPILARVIVNRIWQHYFGQGIVPTPDDFGRLGLPPSHPELLDWLATELIAHNWSLKHIHRLILASSAYRMASELRVESEALRDQGINLPTQHDSNQKTSVGGSQPSTLHPQPSILLSTDPGNTLLWRMNVKRLEGEIIRDAILQLSGRLDETLYGPSVPVHLTEFLEGRGRPRDSGPVDGQGRRSLYVAVRRNFPDPFFQAFDFPTPHSTIGRRNVSNVPAQALALLNNSLVLEQARACGDRLLHLGDDGRADRDAIVAARIRRLYESTYSRPPSPEELEAGAEFLAAQAAALGASLDDPRVWGDYVHVLINAKEFIFIR